ncbi:hypothetical protein Clacol_002047 [Clathrus columnatus]|uniref:SH3 domain-containing protein n=1 Tax=Clathrus columnatus TaxID=1419009 RepID=A0AAV5A322_9AGAM|nr:hypothetical protein Clacol_002047 [Clathrus columnatus]
MTVQGVEPRRPQRQDTFELRKEIHTDSSENSNRFQQNQETIVIGSDEDHSMMDDDSSNEDRDGEYMDEDDGSSSLSIPNEAIDFDLVYSLHNFAATVEGQASVVKGDSLFLMDDSNSYWWLVRVLTTQEVGYIPAENIETPFERLARLNKHRNVDLAFATQEELQENAQTSRDRIQGIRNGNINGVSPNGTISHRKSVVFTNTSRVFNYPPALWGDEEEDEEEEEDWDGEMEYEPDYEHDGEHEDTVMNGPDNMEPDDGMSWEGAAVEQERARVVATAATSTSIVPASPSSPVANAGILNHSVNLHPIDTATAQVSLSPSTVVVSQQQPQQNGILRQQSSRERLLVDLDPISPISPAVTTPVTATSPGNRILVDPAVAGDTRKISATPSIAREAARQVQQQSEEARRAKEEIEDISTRRTKIKDIQPVSSASIMKEKTSNESIKSTSSTGGKLRKGRDSPAPSSSQEDEGVKKEKEKKKTSMFGGLFGRKKDKKEKASEGADQQIRNSEDSTAPSEASSRVRVSNESRRMNVSSPSASGQGNPPVISQQSLRMQQIDQQQQALYHQYLKSSPASTPEGPSHGFQSASIVMPNNNPSNNNNLSTPGFRTQGGRPGSLILSPTGIDGHGPVPELSVIRVFAGPNLHTEATFKTVLLNTSTTASDLIKQAKQRFRLPAGENDLDYYLEIKQIEGHSAILLPDQKPLGVFESLVEAAEMELPKVKRSSVGSISSVASNLSLHPAIKKLSMNDFTDDSAVKFYLNRRSSEENVNGLYDKQGESILRMSMDDYDDVVAQTGNTPPLLTVTTTSGTNVTPEKFNSPSVRFALQVFILPEDLPDEMIFDPQTEAIVPKSSLRDRAPNATIPNGSVSHTQRRKVLHFPKNTTVAEVIELALERFGIAEGVVDGGDEIEDKLAKRVSLARVRYGLTTVSEGQERQLHPSSKVLDAFSRPPFFRAIDRRSGEKRRSADSAYLLHVAEDIRPDDPVFILRRAIGLRNSGKSKPAPLDDYALQKKHHQGHPSHKDNLNTETAAPNIHENGHTNPASASPNASSLQERIAAQRQVYREKQRAILSTQTNSERGVDILLPGNAMLRSTALDASGDKMRYSYVQDGEVYDISDIVEEERRHDAGKEKQTGFLQETQQRKDDWLVHQEGLGDNLDRLLTRIKDSRAVAAARTQTQPGRAFGESANNLSPTTIESRRVSDLSAYSVDDQEEVGSPSGVNMLPQPVQPHQYSHPREQLLENFSSSRTETPVGLNSGRVTPTRSAVKNESPPNKQPSTGSLRSDEGSSSTNEIVTPLSTSSTPATTATQHGGSVLTGRAGSASGARTGPAGRRSPLVMKGDLGVANMITVIELSAGVNSNSFTKKKSSLADYVDDLFGPTLDIEDLHPRVREMYAGTLKQLDEMDRQLDYALSVLYPNSRNT